MYLFIVGNENRLHGNIPFGPKTELKQLYQTNTNFQA